MPRKLDQFPFPQDSPSVEQMSTGGDDNVPEAKSTPRSAGGFLLQDVIHLFHCHLCDKLFTEPVTLPCGRSICKKCMPQAHIRSRISYPAMDDRLEGFRCPFKSCAKEHTLGDCGIDVTLNKLAEHIRSEINLHGPTIVNQPANTIAAQLHNSASTQPESASADRDQPNDTKSEYNHQPLQQTESESGPAATRDHEDSAEQEQSSFTQTQQLTRSELDCQVCYALFHDPLTTGCGHTFCRSCLHRILDHSRYCPLCRRRLSISPLLNRVSCPSNACLTKIIETFWTDELAARRSAIEAEEAARLRDLETPLFVCTLAFPQMPTFLHVFEPRYRLLVRRALEGDKTFGMVLGRRPRHAGDACFHELGTLLRIENAQFFPDGRCLIETVGLSRFRVLRHGSLDGYAVSSVERIDDISLEEEEATEAAEMAAAVAADAAPFPPPDAAAGDTSSLRCASSANSTSTATTTTPPAPITVPSLETMTTRDLMQLATDFVGRMRDQSVPWMTDRMLAIYGECPVQDPAVFPWWLGSVLPVRDAEKLRLLGSASVRARLKICCKWIIEWETKTWSLNTCSIL
ncbi:hypothetical protein LMH87_009709 [Akanthomyces muscarius]|uniref:Uncharacterized protein n=1 Tax=Akanthomyces muscarius TaxID=2231603 RepID=A0A9W8QCJ1_AKAMU|nr:hypothetical protein LMH87_009709 [Akanthomyces muscarius]KAJ4153212.1 hypothetical protein LMH87_009709 [Akanthomyces muscarius]